MPTQVAFLRAVNVGGRTVRMERLRSVLTDLGYRDVATYIQTGNVLVSTPEADPTVLAAALRERLSAEFGFDIPVIVRAASDLPTLVAAIDARPTPLAGEVRTYVTFLDREPDADRRAAFEAWDAPGEVAAVIGSHVVWWLGVSFHEATLTNARIEKGGYVATTRDLKVVRALAQRWGH
jgi:uncharacterized protein (DUF1697 family)